MISILIEKPTKAFLPEALAYRRYFAEDPRFILGDENCDPGVSDTADIEIRFFGFVPKWRRRPTLLVADFNSMSTGICPKAKDGLKRILNAKADVYLALNTDVARRIYPRPQKVLLRPMGYFGDLVRPRAAPDFDLVYAGTLNRPKVLPAINRLARLGLRIAVVGASSVPGADSEVQFFGKLPLSDVYEVYSRAQFGLNIVPEIYPYYFQDSTKVIEYCAAGLGVVSNTYRWIRDFFSQRGGSFLDINQVVNWKDLYTFDYRIPRVQDLEWSRILESIDLAENLVTELDNRPQGR